MTKYSNRCFVVAGALALALVSSSAYAEEHHHETAASAPAKLSLNNGQKWATDASLQKGMASIHKTVWEKMDGIHQGKFKAKDYVALANSIQKDINGIIKGCKLSPQADANLHIILKAIMVDCANMRKKGSSDHDRHMAAMDVMDQLSEYENYFAPTGW